MSDNIPFDIQIQIIKKVSDVKSLVRFRSVSKPWKSVIDSSHFIKSYGARHTQPHSHIISLSQGIEYRSICLPSVPENGRIFCLVDDDSETFKVQQHEFAPFVLSPLLKHHFWLFNAVGACHGLVCLYGLHKTYKKRMLVIWNPSIGKSFCIAAPPTSDETGNWIDYGFGVCPVTKDHIVLKIKQKHNKPWHVEVFTLSLRVWNVIPTSNLPHQSIILELKTQVVIDRFIYWGAYDSEFIKNRILVSFDLIAKEFKVVDLPYSLTNELTYRSVSVSKLRESLVVYGDYKVEGPECCGVWVMESDSSFRKLFSIGSPLYKILGFKNNGEPILEIRKVGGQATLYVYDLCSQQIKNLGISVQDCSSFMGSYKESLLLLDHSDSRIY